MSEFDDVYEFQVAMGLPMPRDPQLLDKALYDFRVKFLKEELQEFILAHEAGDLLKAIDGLIDLVYVAHGTLAFMGIDPAVSRALWKAVHQANMTKRPAVNDEDSLNHTGRGHRYDVVKPPGWVSPDSKMRLILLAAGAKMQYPNE